MPIILSLSYNDNRLWAAGPEGLFYVVENGDGSGATCELQAVPQPQTELACCAAADDQLLVGGSPHGVAFSPDEGAYWQASWMDGVAGPVMCIAPDPAVSRSGVLVAGSAEGGVLRTRNRGQSWSVCNYGLQDYALLTVAWAPVAPVSKWPRWEVVFAGTETGIYRSPNGGLGWRRAEGIDSVVQVIAVSPDFHEDGLVLAGTEDAGLWRSTDGGRTFDQVADAPERVDALTATSDGWLLSDDQMLWRSSDGLSWESVPGSQPALILLDTPDGTWAGGENGVIKLN